MLSNFSQYSPQGFIPQFPGLQGAGWPQMSPGLFGQPGAYAGFVPFAHEPALAGMYPTPFLQNPFVPSPLAPSPLAYNPLLGSFAGYAGAHHPAQQIVLVIEEDHIRVQLRTAIPGMRHIDGADHIDSTALRQDRVQALPHDSHVAHDENAQRHRPAS